MLGDVPVLGYLFKNTGRTADKTELLVFLTPRIVPIARPLAEFSVPIRQGAVAQTGALMPFLGARFQS